MRSDKYESKKKKRYITCNELNHRTYLGVEQHLDPY